MARKLRALMVMMTAVMAAMAGMVPAAAGGGGGCHADRTDARTAQVKAHQNCFVPTVVRVEPGTTVTWRSGDAAPHTVTAAGSGFLARPSDSLTSSRPVSTTFDQPGVYPYVCVLHPTMAGAVVVGAQDGAQAASEITPAAEAGPATAGAAAGVGAAMAVLLLATPRVVRRLRRQTPESS